MPAITVIGQPVILIALICVLRCVLFLVSGWIEKLHDCVVILSLPDNFIIDPPDVRSNLDLSIWQMEVILTKVFERNSVDK